MNCGGLTSKIYVTSAAEVVGFCVNSLYIKLWKISLISNLFSRDMKYFSLFSEFELKVTMRGTFKVEIVPKTSYFMAQYLLFKDMYF